MDGWNGWRCDQLFKVYGSANRPCWRTYDYQHRRSRSPELASYQLNNSHGTCRYAIECNPKIWYLCMNNQKANTRRGSGTSPMTPLATNTTDPPFGSPYSRRRKSPVPTLELNIGDQRVIPVIVE